MVLKLVLCGVPLLLFQHPVEAAQSVILAWTPSPSTNVVSYNIYYGTACGIYNREISVGNTNSATIKGLLDGMTYYFAATAFDSSGVESPFSNETAYNVPTTAATLAALPGSAGQFNFSVSGVSGYQYVVQTSTNLTDWISVQTNLAPFTFTDMNAGQWPQCFYRTFYLPP